MNNFFTVNQKSVCQNNKTRPTGKSLIIKWLVLFLIVPGFQSFASLSYAQSTKITLEIENKTIAEILSVIEKETQFYFTYDPSEVNTSEKISIEVKDKAINEILEQVFSKGEVGHTINGKHVTLYKTDENKTIRLNGTQDIKQSKKFTGTVKDEAGEPLIGVSVKIKGSTTGTVTDINGHFELSNTESSDVLELSYIGYKALEHKVGNNSIAQIILQEDTKALEEVVVVGYGTQKRVNLTGAISTVGSEVMESRPVNNPVAALQGEIPGLTVQRESGSPGEEKFELSVRGASSVNGGNSPLVIIDGIAGDLDLLNPDDIQSISVLKDAQASIYGARAAGGVILVTTKKGKKGIPTISYSGNFASTRMSGMMKSPNTYEFAIMDNEANNHTVGATPVYTSDYLQRILNNDPNPVPYPKPHYGGEMLFFTTTDWMDELLENGFQQKHNLTVSGGGDNSNYYLSAGYIDQQGVVKSADDNNKRHSLRMNYDYSFLKRFKLETAVSLENQERTNIGGVGNYVITEGIFGMPNHPVYTQGGNYFSQGGWGNAVAMAKEGETATFNTRNINTNFKLTADIVDGLKLNLQSGFNFSSRDDRDPARPVPLYNWDDSHIVKYDIASSPEYASLTQLSSETRYANLTAYLQYNKVFSAKHNLDLMVGTSHEEEDSEEFTARRDGFADNGLWEMNLGGTGNQTNSGYGNHWSISSVFARAGYSFDNKYLIETNIRYDGSSRFAGSDQRWGLFPGVSVGWRMSEEQFIKDLNFFDNLKLRASYGTTGNQEGIGLYDFVQKIKIRPEWDPNEDWRYGYYPFGAGSQTQTAVLDGMVAASRTWETITNQNIGVDASFLSQRLDISLDYFIKYNRNMLIPVTYPSLLGTKAPTTNSGDMETKGFEINVGWKDKIGNVSYFVNASLSDAHNKVTNYGGSDTYVLGLNKVREGYPINSYFAYEFDGLIRTQAELDEYKKLEGVPTDIGIGDAKFKDINGDGKISTYGEGDDGDVVYAGSSTPRFTYGVTVGGKFKGFDFSAFFQGVGERTLFREGEYAIPWSDWWRQPPQFYYQQTWNEDRQDAYYPRLSHGSIRHWNYQQSTLQKIDASYIRLKNLQAGYTIPDNLVRKMHLARLRVYFSGQDMWEHHNVPGGWDPEVGAWGNSYPFQRYYSMGVDITF